MASCDVPGDPFLPPGFFRRAVETLSDGVVIARLSDGHAPIAFANAAFERLTGYGPGEILGRDCRLLQGDARDQPAIATLRAAIAAHRACTVVLRNFRRDGTPFWNELSLTPLADPDGVVRHYIGIQKDVSEREALQDALAQRNAQLERLTGELGQMAVTDALTGLYNRRFLDAHLRVAAKASARDARPLALFMIDVDHFKRFNDRHGHVAGDGALQHVAQAIRRTFPRGGDVAARFGGEEFAVVCSGTDDSAAAGLAARLRANLAERAGERVALPEAVTVSIGYAVACGGLDVEPGELVAAADAHLYAAKAAGRDRARGGALAGTPA
jgi:diguanylate cyclase (GGDEF)-like protein/PAS domain S-box-containing protein